MEFIKLLSKNEKEYGLSHKLIKGKITQSSKGKCYVDDWYAMQVWQDLGINQEMIEQIKKDRIIRDKMANECKMY